MDMMKMMEMLSACDENTMNTKGTTTNNKKPKTKKTHKDMKKTREEICYAKYMFYKHKYFLMTQNVNLSEDEEDFSYDDENSVDIPDSLKSDDDNDVNNVNNVNDENDDEKPDADDKNKDDKVMERQVESFIQEMMKLTVKNEDISQMTNQNKSKKDEKNKKRLEDDVKELYNGFLDEKDVQKWELINPENAYNIIREYGDSYSLHPAAFAEFITYYNQTCVPLLKLPVNGISYEMFISIINKIKEEEQQQN